MNQQISTGGRGFSKLSPPMVDPGVAGKHDRGMEDRIRNLESHAVETRDRLMRIETTLGHVATSGDVAASSICLREDMAEMQSGLRKEMTEMQSGLRKEMAELQSGLRKEMAEMQSGLRKEMADIAAALRKEMGDMKAELVTLIARSHTDMIKWSIMSMLTVSTLAFTAAKYIH